MLCIKCKKEIPYDSLYCNWCGKKQNIIRKVKQRGNGYGSVYKRSSGNWQIEITKQLTLEDGKIKRIRRTKGGFKTKKEALEYLPILKNEQKTDTKSIAEIFETIKTREIEELSKDKQSHYYTAYNRIKSIEHKNISDITLSELQEIVDNLELGFYPKRDIKNLLNKLYEYALIEDYCKKNLVKYIKLPKQEK